MTETKTTTRKILKGEDREKLVGAAIRGLIRLCAPSIREAVEALVDGNKPDWTPVTQVLKTQAHDFEKAAPTTPKEMPEALYAASRGTLSDGDKRQLLVLRKRGASYAQLATEFAVNQVMIHALFKSKGLTEGRGEGEETPAEKPAKAPKAAKEKAPKPAKKPRAKKGEKPAEETPAATTTVETPKAANEF